MTPRSLPGPEPLLLMGSGPNQPFSYSLHLLRGRDISTHVLLLHHQDRVLPRSFTHWSRSSRLSSMTSLLHWSCLDRLSHLTGSSVISRACSTLSLSLRVEDYIHPSQNVYLGQHRFSRRVGCVSDRLARAAITDTSEPGLRPRGRATVTMAVDRAGAVRLWLASCAGGRATNDYCERRPARADAEARHHLASGWGSVAAVGPTLRGGW